MPNSHYHDQFDYSYTGLSIYWEDGIIRIGDIMPGSPAEKAGLRADDILLAINTNFSNSIQTYKAMLQSPGDKLKLIVRRNKELVTLTMRVKSIR
jgi:C-terminal processing protease CtpA/Prc